MKIFGLWGLLIYLEFCESYSRVSMNNGQARSRDVIDFTVSPNTRVIIPSSVDLKPGEAIDHPVSYEDPTSARVSRFQDRFTPSANFRPLVVSGSNDDAIYSKPAPSSMLSPMTYDYPPAGGNSKPTVSNKPTSSSGGGDSLPVYPPLKIPDYSSGPLESIPPQLSKPPRYEFDQPPKSIEFAGYYDHPFDNHHHHEEIIYDHIPDDHYFHHHHHHQLKATTTEEPMDQRLDRRPYSYYNIGKKLWYVPLYFSIYFIIYIAALVLKSIARHKINFPTALAAAAASQGNARQSEPGWMDYVVNVLEGIQTYAKKG